MGLSNTNGNIIETSGLTKFYGSHPGIQELNLEVRSGEVFGLLGPNGAGKTTTIRLLMGFLAPTAGSASILGKNCWSESIYIHRELGYIPGDVRHYGNMTGQQTLDFFNRLRPNRPPIMLPELMEKLPLDLSKRIKEYSQGMRQKLAIILAFMHRPRLLVLDEPTLGLDPLMQQAFYELLASARDTGSTIFISSHILPEMERVCDRVGIVRASRLVAVERIPELASMKIRRVRFTLAPGTPAPERLAGFPVHRSETGEFDVEVRGPIDPFIKELAALPLEELEISHASLEEIFLEYYRNEETHTARTHPEVSGGA